MIELSTIQQACIWALPLIFAITFHEVAHGYIAHLCGDNTAKAQGRLSANPMRHIDPIGTIVMPLVIGMLTHFTFLFGYAKPVPVTWRHLRHPRRDMVFVAAAGPLSNLAMALIWGGLFKVATLMNPESSSPVLFLLLTARAGISINLILAVLNLLPIPPLDGSKVLMGLLPARQAMSLAALEPYGIFILLALMFTNVLQMILGPFINAGLSFIGFLFHL